MDKIQNEVMKILDQFLNAFNKADIDAWEKTFHFPHYRLASGVMSVLNGPGERKLADVKQYLKSIGFHHSKWDHRQIIHMSDTKAHVDTKFTRYRIDGTVIGSYESLYILTKENGKWGIKMRSSFAK